MYGSAMVTNLYLNNPVDSVISKHIDIIKANPDSHALIEDLSHTLHSYHTKQQAAFLYELFSDRQKNSYYGKKIYRYLNDNQYKNRLLRSAETGEPELIITDTTKHTLVVFSASWCAPCHAMIPLLKQIYADLKDNMEVVYVSIDEAKSVNAWKEVLKKEQIPWRSVMAYEDVNSVRDQYMVPHIPYSILVAPDGTMEPMDVREDSIKEKLYKVFDK